MAVGAGRMSATSPPPRREGRGAARRPASARLGYAGRRLGAARPGPPAAPAAGRGAGSAGPGPARRRRRRHGAPGGGGVAARRGGCGAAGPRGRAGPSLRWRPGEAKRGAGGPGGGAPRARARSLGAAVGAEVGGARSAAAHVPWAAPNHREEARARAFPAGARSALARGPLCPPPAARRPAPPAAAGPPRADWRTRPPGRARGGGARSGARPTAMGPKSSPWRRWWRRRRLSDWGQTAAGIGQAGAKRVCACAALTAVCLTLRWSLASRCCCRCHWRASSPLAWRRWSAAAACAPTRGAGPRTRSFTATGTAAMSQCIKVSGRGARALFLGSLSSGPASVPLAAPRPQRPLVAPPSCFPACGLLCWLIWPGLSSRASPSVCLSVCLFPHVRLPTPWLPVLWLVETRNCASSFPSLLLPLGPCSLVLPCPLHPADSLTYCSLGTAENSCLFYYLFFLFFFPQSSFLASGLAVVALSHSSSSWFLLSLPCPS